MSDDTLPPGGIHLGKGRIRDESVLLAMRARAVGGSAAAFVGVPGSGKSALAYLLLSQRRAEERVWVRGTADDGWWWWFGREAIVWVPAGCEAQVYGVDGRTKLTVDATVRAYSSLADLLERAEVGKVHVLYWPTEGWGSWVAFLLALVDRDDTLPQLVLDDEAHETFPESGFGGDDLGETPFERIRRGLRVLANSRKANVSHLLVGHQGHDISTYILGKVEFWLLLAGSRIPRKVEEVAPDEVLDGLRRLVGRLHRGRAVAVGGTPYGYLYEEVGSDEAPIPAPPPRRFRVKVRVRGPAPSASPSPRANVVEGSKTTSGRVCRKCGRHFTSAAKRPQCPGCASQRSDPALHEARFGAPAASFDPSDGPEHVPDQVAP